MNILFINPPTIKGGGNAMNIMDCGNNKDLGKIAEARYVAHVLQQPVKLLPHNLILDPNDPCKFGVDSTLCKREHCDKCEMCELFDSQGNDLGRASPRYYPTQEGEYHLCIQLFVINKGLVLLEKRAPTVVVNPNTWSMITGMVQEGETPEHAAEREAFEEVGIDICNISKGDTFLCNKFVSTIYYAFYIGGMASFKLQKEEVSAIKWVPIKQLLDFMPIPENFNYYDYTKVFPK